MKKSNIYIDQVTIHPDNRGKCLCKIISFIIINLEDEKSNIYIDQVTIHSEHKGKCLCKIMYKTNKPNIS